MYIKDNYAWQEGYDEGYRKGYADGMAHLQEKIVRRDEPIIIKTEKEGEQK